MNDDLIGPFIAHGQWAFVVVTEDNAPTIDSLAKRKLYVDGVMVNSSAVFNTTMTLGGASRFRIGQWPDGAWAVYLGATIDSIFVCNYILDQPEIAALYAKGSMALGVSAKSPGDNIEQMTSTHLFCAFDDLESQHQVDLAVA